MAIKITYETPAPDRTFEIMLMRREKADQFHSPFGKHEIIKFKDGVDLAGKPDCIGGQKALEEARRFEKFNPFVQKLNLHI